MFTDNTSLDSIISTFKNDGFRVFKRHQNGMTIFTFALKNKVAFATLYEKIVKTNISVTVDAGINPLEGFDVPLNTIEIEPETLGEHIFALVYGICEKQKTYDSLYWVRKLSLHVYKDTNGYILTSKDDTILSACSMKVEQDAARIGLLYKVIENTQVGFRIPCHEGAPFSRVAIDKLGKAPLDLLLKQAGFPIA